jgi:hypothetical protein
LDRCDVDNHRIESKTTVESAVNNPSVLLGEDIDLLILLLFHFDLNSSTDTLKSVSYPDLHLEIENGGRLKTKLHDKCDYFTFPIGNFTLNGQPDYDDDLIIFEAMTATYK